MAGEQKAEKSYLASAVDSINPWGGSRSSTPTPKDPQPPKSQPPNPGDHISNHLYGRSFKTYPPDCPPLNVQWFHAADVPKRKPKFPYRKTSAEDKKPPVQPKKYSAFSPEDSRAIEDAYQKKIEELESLRAADGPRRTVAGSKRPRVVSFDEPPNTSLESAENPEKQVPGTRVPVNEDFLFDVEIETRELAPVYWLGPVYDVRRGTWFYQEGSTIRPCEENLAAQLEEGYLKIKPWQYPARARSNSAAKDVTPKASVENLKAASAAAAASAASATQPETGVKTSSSHQPETHRLFGTYMNSVVTYQDSSTAWLSSDSVISWMTSTMYERFAGGAYLSGIKLVRGYTEQKKVADEKRPTTPTGTKSTSVEKDALELDERQQKLLKRRSAPPSVRSETSTESSEQPKTETRAGRLTRQLSDLLESSENRDPDKEAEAVRRREEEEIQDDYNARQGETQGRDIEHLILVTHGIGQLLGLRTESVNFVHDVNILRKTLKSVYSTSADLRALNSEVLDGGPGNCRIQVLPVVWRHLLEFPRKREKKGERDIGETSAEEDDYPSLEDITIEGVAFARSLISDLALDVLLYQSAYREQISEIVLKESNRIYKLFKERNPEFKGKVHIVGHSLGSAIMFDILCRQREATEHLEPPRNPLRFWPSQDRYEPQHPKELAFEFETEDFFCLGSPVGLFQMLKGRTIAARHLPNSFPSESPLNPEYMDDPFFTAPLPSSHSDERVSPITRLPYSISSPKVTQLFNVFHPSDPISYRLEPLITPAMAGLKPQNLPYTKKGIFGSVAPQGLTGIGVKVGQSVSGLWSSLSSGIASSLLNRSLGLSQEDVAKLTESQSQQSSHAQSPGAGTNVIGGGVISPDAEAAARAAKAAERKRQLANAKNGEAKPSSSGNDVTLLDDDLETLFSRFEKQRVDLVQEEGLDSATLRDEERREEERRAQKLRHEESKVRALNRNGRVDYSIQESVLDFNPINTIASHMAYWSDEDVSHFIMSQLLSNKKRRPR